jgi:hypothetical protein
VKIKKEQIKKFTILQISTSEDEIEISNEFLRKLNDGSFKCHENLCVTKLN